MLGKECVTCFRIKPTEPNNDASQVGSAPRDILKHASRLQADHASAVGEDGCEDDGGRSDSSDSGADGPNINASHGSTPHRSTDESQPIPRSGASSEYWVVTKSERGNY